MGVVDAADRRPELVGFDERQRKRRLLAAVRMRPVVGGNRRRGVRRVLQHVVFRIGLAVDDRLNLLPDRDHRVAEPIELFLRLAFGRLDHQRAGDRKRHRRRVKAVIHQPLRHVELFHARRLESAQVEDHLVRDRAVRPRVQHVVMRLEALLDVVRVQDGVLRGVGHALGAQHADVAVGDQQDARRAPGRRRDRANRLRAANADDRMAGQERREVRRHADRPHAGSAAAVRDRERLVQVQVADVGADRRRAREPDLRVHVRAVHVDLAAVLMNDGADVLDGVLEHAMRRRIGHHQRRQRDRGAAPPSPSDRRRRCCRSRRSRRRRL